ncbi:hypothetical protein LINPERPRIM_LOCUS37813, partial [Linum perenne]
MTRSGATSLECQVLGPRLITLPGWVLARFFHQKTKTTKTPRSLLGGNFVGRLIINLGLSQWWGLDVPRRVIHTIGGDLAVEY